MNLFIKIVRRWLFVALLCSTLAWPCYSHDWPVHMAISRSAFGNSAGLQTFVDNANLGAQFLFANTPETDGPLSPREWLAEGSRMEDEQAYPLLDVFGLPIGHHVEERTLDHIYTVTPQRAAGQVIGLTDFSEPSVVGSIFSLLTKTTNSFRWATQDGIVGPSNVGTNYYKWDDARNYEFAALTNATQDARNTNMAMIFYTLGHVLHLNQDLTSPDHARDANHYNTAYIEDYGQAHYLDPQKSSQWFVLPQNATVGWANWQAQGFSQLLDFWDRDLYSASVSPHY